MQKVEITRKGNKIEVYSEFMDAIYKGEVTAHGTVKAKTGMEKRMIMKAIKLEKEGKI